MWCRPIGISKELLEGSRQYAKVYQGAGSIKPLSPVRSSGKQQKALLLLKREMVNDTPERLDRWMILMVATIISSGFFQIRKVVMWQATDK